MPKVISDTTKERARQRTHRALRKGIILKPARCERCNAKEIQAHHPNYEQPLAVMWLCAKCHTKEHVANGSYARRGQKQCSKCKELLSARISFYAEQRVCISCVLKKRKLNPSI